MPLNKIKHLNRAGANNDMLDVFEAQLTPEEKKAEAVITQLSEWRKQKDVIINYTQNEIDQLKYHLSQARKEASPEIKVRKLLEIMDYKMRMEIKEAKDRKGAWIETPQKILHRLKGVPFKTAKLGEIYEGKSDYVVILIPQTHIYHYLNEEPIDFAVGQLGNKNVQSHILDTWTTLFRQGFGKVFLAEGLPFREYADDLPEPAYEHFRKIYDEYLEGYKKVPYHLRGVYQDLGESDIFTRWGAFMPEVLAKNEVYTFGAEDVGELENAVLVAKLLEIIMPTLLALPEILFGKNPKVEYSKEFLIDVLMGVGEKGWPEWKKHADLFRDFLEKAIVVPPRKGNLGFLAGKPMINKANYEMVKKQIHSVLFEAMLVPRNRVAIQKIKQTRENTLSNALILKIGAAHIKGNKFHDQNTIPDLLKEKEISYAVLWPDGVELDHLTLTDPLEMLKQALK